MAELDLNTMQYLSAVIMVVLSMLMLVLWLKNKEEAIEFWCIFAALVCFDTVLSCFPEMRNMSPYVYVYNTMSSYAYFSLMLGCLTFANLKINKIYILGLYVGCALLNRIGAVVEFSDEYRRAIIILFNAIAIIISVSAISKLSTRVYAMEKFFLLALLSMHFVIHALWMVLNFTLTSLNDRLYSQTTTSTFIILILIMIGLQLLSLGKIRYRLERANERSIAIKKALSNGVRETNVANNSKSVFLTNMSHELRTPLNIILGFSEALTMGYVGQLNDKQKSFVENIHRGGTRLLNLINDLLFLSKIETGNLKMDFEEIKPEELLTENKELFTSIARKYNCPLHFIEDFQDFNSEDRIFANKEWTKQIFSSLLDNAAKYAKRNSNIWINIFAGNEQTMRISIKDQGEGIKQDQQENVFKPFNRAGIESKFIEGTGTGLAIAKGLAEAMGGNLDFESRRGVGTTFWLELPLKRTSLSAP